MNFDRVNLRITQSVSHMKQCAIDLREEFLQKNDSDDSSDEEDDDSDDGYNYETSYCRANRERQWFDDIISDEKMISRFLWTVTALPIIDMGYRFPDEPNVPCYCSFHNRFCGLFDSYDTRLIQRYDCECSRRGTGRFTSRHAFKDHLRDHESWYHRLLGYYVVEMNEAQPVPLLNIIINSDTQDVTRNDVNLEEEMITDNNNGRESRRRNDNKLEGQGYLVCSGGTLLYIVYDICDCNNDKLDLVLV